MSRESPTLDELYGVGAEEADAAAQNDAPAPRATAFTGTLKKGDHFEHRYWLNGENNEPLHCVVTSVLGNWYYYRPIYLDGSRGLGHRLHRDTVSRYVARLLPND